MSVKLLRIGAGGDRVHITSRTYFDTVSGAGGTSSVTFRLNLNGKVQYVKSHSAGSPPGTFGDFENWVTPTANAPLYECRVDITSGTLTSGTTGTWLALTSSRSWTKTETNNDDSVTITVQIRLVGSTSSLISTTVILEADGSF